MRFPALLTIFLAACTAATVFGATASDTVYTKSNPDSAPITMSDSVAACSNAQHSRKFPVNCVVTYVQGRPTLAVEFIDERSMNAYLGAFAKYVAEPFCEAANKGNQEAYFVIALKNPRVGSVSSCETGESSSWISLDTLGPS